MLLSYCNSLKIIVWFGTFTLVEFTRTANVTVFVSGTFDLFDVLCKQHIRTVLSTFFTVQKL